MAAQQSPGGGGREAWGSRLGVILAVTGSAVGLGNFLRFPGVAVANGGGAFMVPYIIAFLIVGLPIAWIEWAMGRYAGRRGFSSAAGIYRVMTGGKTWASYLGVLALIIPVVIYMYYLSVEAWCLGFAWHYWTGGMAVTVATAQQGMAAGSAEATEAGVGAANNYLVGFSGLGENFSLATNFWTTAAPFVLLCFVINFFLIWRGLNKGIELFCRWAMPALILCSIVILARVLTLGSPEGATEHTIYHPEGSIATERVDAAKPSYEHEGTLLVPETVQGSVGTGLGFMWNPVGHSTVKVPTPGAEADADGVVPTTSLVVEESFLSAMMDPDTWLAAAGQIFFSLSVALGVIITYASYTKPKDDIALSGLTAAAGNGFFEIALGGMMVIPAAFMFASSGAIVSAGEKASSLSLGFFALPGVFEHMPGGHFFGGLFFFLLFLAAVTSSLSMLQPAIAFLEEGLGIGRHASVAILGVITALGAGFVALISSGLTVLDHMDFWMGNFALFLLAMAQIVLFAWVVGVDKGLKELSIGAEITLPRSLPFVLRYVTPSFLVLVFGFWLVKNISLDGGYLGALRPSAIAEDPIPALTVLFILVIAAFFLLLIMEAVKRWKRLEAAGVLPDPSRDPDEDLEGGAA
ncbi:MAG: sodium:calcium symporter [Planctomycetota bacterium]|nr:sodium:calcium symporter [Planctomycetota bacterium]